MTRLLTVLCLAVVIGTGSDATAQRTPKFRGIFGVGVSAPTGDANQLWNMGFHGLAGVGFQVTPFTQFVPNIEYHGMPLDNMGLPNISGGTLHVLMLGSDIIATANVPESDVKPQFLIGFGMGHVSISDLYESGENRVIVKRGLAGLDRVRNPGLRALLDVSGFPEGESPSARQVAFQVAPRINAAGRMASAAHVIQMFLTEDLEVARTLAAKLHELNSDRRDTESDIVRTIFEQCVEQPVTDLDAALVFAGEGWHRGVVGIVASRVVERFHRPAFVLGLENGMAQGSGRSIPVFHLLEALEAMPDLFGKFGGHRQAAGITMDAGRVEEFRARLRAYAGERLTPADFERELPIDAEIALEEIDDASIADILKLAPFGFGNAAPTFAVRGVEIAAPPDIIKEKHVFLKLKVAGRTIRAKAWNFAERAAELVPGARVDIALQFEDDPYSAARGYAPWQTIVRDIRASVGIAAAPHS